MSNVAKKSMKKSEIPKTFRLFDYKIQDENPDVKDSSSSSEEEINRRNRPQKYEHQLYIQMFGVNEIGETCCLFVTNYKPFFYIKVGGNWDQTVVNLLLGNIRSKIGSYYDTSILGAELVEHPKLYGFTAGKSFKFAKMTFKNLATLNRVKNLWYDYVLDEYTHKTEKVKKTFIFPSKRIVGIGPTKEEIITPLKLELYESNIPPLLRYFHIHSISPSGWVSVPTNKVFRAKNPTTTCKYEYICTLENITPLPMKETVVPYKICSYDIEASSSHGDFPVPKKTYKKLAMNMVDCFSKSMITTPDKTLLYTYFPMKFGNILKMAFGFSRHDADSQIDIVYPKIAPSRNQLKEMISILLEKTIQQVCKDYATADTNALLTIDTIFDRIRDKGILNGGGEEGDAVENDEPDDEINIEETEDLDEHAEDHHHHHLPKTNEMNKKTNEINKKTKKETKLVDVIFHTEMKREEKIQIINEVLTNVLPKLEGDKTTFIGSTFLRYGEQEPYLNHCIVLGTCDPVNGAVIETTTTERELLLKWTELIQHENPDIIIGYNIFGFDYEFMFRRAEENNCVHPFLQLSRQSNELCGTQDQTGQINIENNKIVLASGPYDLRFYKMTGRLQIDMLYYLRRDFNLSSYKLDDVAGQYICDTIKHVICNETNKTTELYCQNITGLHAGDYVHLETVGFTRDYHKNGKKYQVVEIAKYPHYENPRENEHKIVLQGFEPEIVGIKGMKWCIAKDDVSPQDIFRLTNGTSSDRSIVAKYCIQDCNLVHHIMNKIDVLTGYIEMSNICSVPISFLVFRGQGIKLTSFVAKKCRERNTLMPDIDKSNDNDGYEGAIVLPPKCGIYMDKPVACVDYSSLYPSVMISNNLSPDSKVWTKEYNLKGELVRETGNPVYDNLEGYKYIDIEFDNFKYLKNPLKPVAKAVKTKVGKTVCRWAQFPNHQKGIMPSILEELLKARSDTRKQIKNEKDPFMQNILDKRQLGYKVTANSLYGQCGSKTSTFYEKDVAASTTATGRMMIMYAKNMIENVYGDRYYNTKTNGLVHTRAEYIYGDSVSMDTPVYMRIFKNDIVICSIGSIVKKYGHNNWQPCKESGKEEKEYCDFKIMTSSNKDNTIIEPVYIETWTEHGWTHLQRVIRHRLAKYKKMFRITTARGTVDATEDHSFVHLNGEKISPKDCIIGTELLHHPLTKYTKEDHQEKRTRVISSEEATLMGYFFGKGVCSHYEKPFLKHKYFAIDVKPTYTDTLRDDSLKIKYLNLCKMVYPEFEWVCLNSYDYSSEVIEYTIYPNYTLYNESLLRSLVKQYNKELYQCDNDDKHFIKIVPLNILFSSIEIRKSFWEGVVDSKCDYFNTFHLQNPEYSISSFHNITASYICLLANSIDLSIKSIKKETEQPSSREINASIIKREKITMVFYKKTLNILEEELTDLTNHAPHVNPNKIVSIEPLNCSPGVFVYDLTTDNHHFAAGIGNMIVHNTDSVFFTFNLHETNDEKKSNKNHELNKKKAIANTNPEIGDKISGQKALEITIEIAQDVASLCSKWLKPPMELSYEKTLMPFIILSKKRYVGMLYETEPTKGKMKFMGLSIKRRDSCDYLKDVYGGILNILMKEHNLMKSIDYLDDSLSTLIQGNVSIEKLLMTKSLRSDYKNPLQIAHKVLADRIGEREPGMRPKPGDRIQFLHFVNSNKKALQGDKIETPEYISQNNLAIDYSFYITNQLMKPILQLYGLAVEEILEKKQNTKSVNMIRRELDELEKTYSNDLETLHKKREKICSQKAKELLFDKYLQQIQNRSNGIKFDLMHYYSKSSDVHCMKK